MNLEVDETVLIVSIVALPILALVSFQGFLEGVTFNFGNLMQMYRETFSFMSENPFLALLVFGSTIGVAVVIVYGNVGYQETEVRE